MTLRPITNRQSDGRFAMPEDGWFQLCPLGEFPHAERGLVQVLDRTALEAMANRLREDGSRLIDFDHFSYDPARSSEAAGWIDELQVREDGLWARARWSDLGQAALSNGRFRFISPAWLPADCESLGGTRVRPMRLDTAGLTNQPNLRGMAPLTNRTAGEPGTTQSTPHRTMKTVANRLGLSPDASEDAVLAEVNKIIAARDQAVAEVAPLKNRVTELEGTVQKSRSDQADADLETFKDVIPPNAREAWKAQLIANRDGSVALLKGIQEKALNPQSRSSSTVPVLQNRAQGGAGGSAGAGATTSAEEIARAQAIAIENYRLANRCTYVQARDVVRAQHPELFVTPQAAA